MAAVHGGDMGACQRPLRRRLHAFNRRPGGPRIAQGEDEEFRRPVRPLHQRRAPLPEVGFGIFVGAPSPGPLRQRRAPLSEVGFGIFVEVGFGVFVEDGATRPGPRSSARRCSKRSSGA